MKKQKKHQFRHLDPERTAAPTRSNKNVTKNEVVNESSLTSKDLKRTTITMVVFLAFLIGFYFLNYKIDLLQKFIDLLSI
jgi:hypothetical protein